MAQFAITRRKLRNYLIFLTICLTVPIIAFYIYCIPALHMDFMTRAALHPTVLAPETPINDTTAGIKAKPLTITVTREGEKIKLSAVLYKKPGKRIFIYSHGNAGCIDNRFNNFRVSCALNENISVLIYDYEGYGRSQGKLGYDHLIDDARAVYDYVLSQGYKPQDILLFGESLGGGVSSELAGRVPVRGVLIDCSFTSPEGWAKSQFSPANLYPRFCFPAPHYDNLDFVSHDHPLTLVVSAAHDQSIPAAHAQEMKAAAVGQTRFLHLPQSQHCYVVEADRPAFAQAMTDFVSAAWNN